MLTRNNPKILAWMSLLILGCGCTDNSPAGPSSVTINSPSFPTPTISQIQGMYAQFTNGVQVTVGAQSVTLRSNGIPEHPSSYFGAGHSLYEAPHTGMVLNPHGIAGQNYAFQVPVTPGYASPSDTPMGPIGLAVNGVALFNQYAAGRQPLTFEIASFDRYNGHPAPGDTYHYHLEPLWLTATSRSRLVGVLLDGFPVYGPDDSGGHVPTDLDACHGHVSATVDFPLGMYHYHANEMAPYIAGCFRGTPGTV
jgi:hypothetical protein